MDNKGFLVTFEGVDGSGKSTIINMIYDYLQQKGIKCICTREPGGKDNVLAEKIRQIILDNNTDIDERTEALLFAASRSYHVINLIKPKLAEGYVILCDRYVDSSIVYQGYAKKVGMDLIEKINEFAIQDVWPHLTIYLQINKQTYDKRITQRKNLDRLDKSSKILNSSIIEGYDLLSKKHADRYVTIDANKSVEEVYESVLNILKKRIKI